MRATKGDEAYLWDMLDAAETISGFISGVGYERYIHNRMLQMAVERGLEIIGEAARHISDEFKREHPEIKWRSIIAQRNILAHEYDEVKQRRIWVFLGEYIPELINKLKPLIPPVPDDEKE